MRKITQPLTALYYNCSDPITILSLLQIRPDKALSGIYMNEFFDYSSNGPFKISFKQSPWFEQFIRVMYWSPPIKPHSNIKIPSKPIKRFYTNQDCIKVLDGAPMVLHQKSYLDLLISKGGNESQLCNIWKMQSFIQDDSAWYSPKSVKFKTGDIASIMFMTNAEDPLGAFATHKIRSTLKEQWGSIYIEDIINHPQLV
jgi:hypothetical protein